MAEPQDEWGDHLSRLSAVKSPRNEIGAGRDLVGRRAGELLQRARLLLEHGATLRSRPASLRERIRQQIEAIRARRTHALLSDVPLESLRSSVARGTRLQNLRDAGFRSVADALAATPAELVGVAGIGPHSAQQVHRAARARADEVRARSRVSIDAAKRDPAQTELLANLAAARRADTALSDIGDELDALTEQIEPVLAAARRTSSRSRMLFSTRANRRRALQALDSVNAMLTDPYVVSLEQRLDDALADTGPAEPAAVWNAYLADAAPYHALLSTQDGVTATADEQEAAGRAVPIGPQVITYSESWFRPPRRREKLPSGWVGRAGRRGSAPTDLLVTKHWMQWR